jgi:hypothetical protein
MKLRRHQGVHGWPPVWAGRGPHENECATGEIGILRSVRPSLFERARLFLVIEHEDREYIGTLVFEDFGFCQHIYKLLVAHLGQSIQRIGEIDLLICFDLSTALGLISAVLANPCVT